MAIIFELFIECALRADADAVAAHFSDLEHVLLSGKKIKWGTGHEDQPGAFGLTVSCLELSTYGVRTVQDAVEIAEAGLYLLHHLKSAPPFRYARAALESSLIWSADLEDYFETDTRGRTHTRLECVLDEKLYQQLGQPEHFVPFRPGYWWHIFYGEIYKPLGSKDQPALDAICRRLFHGDYFKY